MLGLVFGHTVFAVTTVLTAFMAGLGLGSWTFGRIADRQARPLRLYGLLEIGVGGFCLLVPVLLPVVERAYLALARSVSPSFLVFSLAQFVLVLALLLLPTTLMGATLPVLSRLFVTEPGTLGRRVGSLYALNTFGAVVGTALAGYVLLPALGMRATLTLAALVNLAVGGLIVLADQRLAALAGARGGVRGSTPPPAVSIDDAAEGEPAAAPHAARTGGRRRGLDDLRGRVDARAEPRARQLDLRLHGDAAGLPAGSGTRQRDLLAPVRRPPARSRGLRPSAARCRRGSARHPARLRAACPTRSSPRWRSRSRRPSSCRCRSPSPSPRCWSPRC